MKDKSLWVVGTAFLGGALLLTAGCSTTDSGPVVGSGSVRTEERKIETFKAIEAGGAIELEVAAQREPSVEVSIDDNLVRFVETEVSGDTLRVKTTQEYTSNIPLRVKVGIPVLASLKVSDASRANVTGASGEKIELEASGAARLKVEGVTNNLNAQATGASTIDAEALRATNVIVKAVGASNATVFAAESIGAEATGASRVTYAGNPKTVTKNASGASSVSPK